MSEDISRRDWIALVGGAGAASMAAAQAEGAEPAQECPPAADRCPYFDQSLFCQGKKYCQ